MNQSISSVIQKINVISPFIKILGPNNVVLRGSGIVHQNHFNRMRNIFAIHPMKVSEKNEKNGLVSYYLWDEGNVIRTMLRQSFPIDKMNGVFVDGKFISTEKLKLALPHGSVGAVSTIDFLYCLSEHSKHQHGAYFKYKPIFIGNLSFNLNIIRGSIYY